MKALKHNRGMVAPIAGMLMLIVGIAVLFLSIFIASELGTDVNNSLMAGNNTDLNGIYNSSASLAYSGLQIMGIALIVIGAGVVISTLKTTF